MESHRVGHNWNDLAAAAAAALKIFILPNSPLKMLHGTLMVTFSQEYTKVLASPHTPANDDFISCMIW